MTPTGSRSHCPTVEGPLVELAAWTASTSTTITSRSPRRSAPSPTRRSCRTTSTGSGPASRRARSSPRPGGAASSAWRSPSSTAAAAVDDFRFNQVLDEQIALRRHRRRRPRHQPAQRHLPAVLPELLHRRAEAALAARHRLRRADHRGRDDRAGRRLGPGRHPHQRQARRRPLRRQRQQDVHHQRHQRRPRDHRRAHRRPDRHQGMSLLDPRARHARLRARAQPRQARPALPGHRRAVVHRRAGAGREPARRGGRGVRPAHRRSCRRSGMSIAVSAHRRGARRVRGDAALRQGPQGVRHDRSARSRTPSSCWPR